MVLEDRWLRETYVDLLIEYAAKNKDIVILEADLMKAGGTSRFAPRISGREHLRCRNPGSKHDRNSSWYVSNGQNPIHPYIHSFCHQTSLRLRLPCPLLMQD